MKKNVPRRGGKRKEAGRKPEADKKVPVTIYPRQSRIDRLGLANIKSSAIEHIEKWYEEEIN